MNKRCKACNCYRYKNVYHYVTCILLSLLTVCSCSLNTNEANLIIRIQTDVTGRSILPSIDMEPSYFTITGIGPGEITFSYTTAHSVYTAENLVPGTWLLSANAYNKDEIEIGTGSCTTELVAGNETETAISISPSEGFGNLEIACYWPEGSIQDPAVTAEINGPIGNENAEIRACSIELTPGHAICSLENIPSGYHTLTLAIFDGSERIGGCIETVRILKSADTIGNVEVPLNWNTSAETEISLSYNSNPPLNPIILPPRNRIFIGETIMYTAVMPENTPYTPDGFCWYEDGVQISSEAMFSYTPEIGSHRLDLLTTLQSEYRAGSSSIVVDVFTPYAVGDTAYFTDYTDSSIDVNGLSGARHVDISKDNEWIAVTAYSDDTITFFKNHLPSHTPQPAKTEGTGLYRPFSCTFSQSSTHLFALGSDSSGNDAVGVYELEADVWTLAAVFSSITSGYEHLTGLRDITVNHDNGIIYICATGINQDSGSISLWEYDNGNTALILQRVISAETLQTEFTPPTSLCLISPSHEIAVASREQDTITFINPGNTQGEESVTGIFTDNTDGVDCLNAPEGIAVTSDGAFVYCASYYDSGFSRYAKDPESGLWTYSGCVSDNDEGVSGLYYTRDICINPSDNVLYAAGGAADSLALFELNKTTGETFFIGKFEDGLEGINNLDGIRDIAISEDGKSITTASSNDNSLTVFHTLP